MLESLLAFLPLYAAIHTDLIGGLRAKLLAQEAISFSAASASAVAINCDSSCVGRPGLKPFSVGLFTFWLLPGY